MKRLFHNIIFLAVCLLLIILGSGGLRAFSADMRAYPVDTLKVDTLKVDTLSRSYAPVQKKMSEQSVRLDSIIMKLRNEQIKK